jgi:hypothetical protein
LIEPFEGELRWLTEEASDGRCMASNGIGKERGRRFLRFRIGTILRKCMNKMMDGWFMLENEVVFIFSTKIPISPVFE